MTPEKDEKKINYNNLCGHWLITEKKKKTYKSSFTVKLLKILTPKKTCCNYPKIGTVLFYCRVMGPKDVGRIANSEDPDQTAHLGAV